MSGPARGEHLVASARPAAPGDPADGAADDEQHHRRRDANVVAVEENLRGPRSAERREEGGREGPRERAREWSGRGKGAGGRGRQRTSGRGQTQGRPRWQEWREWFDIEYGGARRLGTAPQPDLDLEADFVQLLKMRSTISPKSGIVLNASM